MIHITDIKPDIRIQLQCGIVFTINDFEPYKDTKLVNSIDTNGSKYRTELNDAVLFFNENKSILL
jgi:hypothetical protein